MSTIFYEYKIDGRARKRVSGIRDLRINVNKNNTFNSHPQISGNL